MTVTIKANWEFRNGRFQLPRYYEIYLDQEAVDTYNVMGQYLEDAGEDGYRLKLPPGMPAYQSLHEAIARERRSLTAAKNGEPEPPWPPVQFPFTQP
jgi:hypothetical protein